MGLVVIGSAAAPDVGLEALDADEDVAVLWEISRLRPESGCGVVRLYAAWPVDTARKAGACAAM